MIHKKRLTEKEFDQIKLFLTTGAKMNKIAQILSRSYATVLRVNKLKTYSDLVEQNRKYAEHIRGKNGAKDVSFPTFNEVNPFYVKAEVAKIQEAVGNLVALIK